METQFYSNYSEERFVDRLNKNLGECNTFYFTVSFIKKAGLKLILPYIKLALDRGAKGKLITTTYQNFTDIESLRTFLELQNKYKNQFTCHLDYNCMYDQKGNKLGYHTKGYLFEFDNHKELLVGSSNITLYALLKNMEWDVSVCDQDNKTYDHAKKEFDRFWEKTLPLSLQLVNEYETQLYYSVERWDMDYVIANDTYKPNYMQKRALKELNRIRVMGTDKALIVASAGSGKTYLAAFDARNFDPKRLLYIVKEGSILKKALETFQNVFGNDKSYGLYTMEYKDFNADFVFSTNITMSNSLDLFDQEAFDYIVIDECHHSTASTYKKIIEYFKPEFLLGLTATPERMDGEDVFDLFDYNVPFELRLRDSIINNLVVPFKYYGIRDELIEYGIKETKTHKFIEKYSDENHCEFIYQNIEKRRLPDTKLKALAFCRDVSHAIRMSQAMEEYYNTRVLTGKNSMGERVRAYNDLQNDSEDLEILFTVDILNEGVDIPGVNMVLFLRPTDSPTVFIQQLGRGLRKYENKEYVTVLDFIGNDYRRSVQIAFALGGLSDRFVMEKNLLANLIKDDFKSLGLVNYGVEINIDELSKKEILSYIETTNFNSKAYLEQDYKNFKRYLGSVTYPSHMDYLNNDFAPDLIKFMQITINNKKNRSYYNFLRGINEESAPTFKEDAVKLINYLSELLPIEKPYPYFIIKYLIQNDKSILETEIIDDLKKEYANFNDSDFNYYLNKLIKSGFVEKKNKEIQLILHSKIGLGTELYEYMIDLLDYGLERYEIEYGSSENMDSKYGCVLWGKYIKKQALNLFKISNIMPGTYYLDKEREVIIFVTVEKEEETEQQLKYDDGFIDHRNMQWESKNSLSEDDKMRLVNSEKAYVFVRKMNKENGVILPFTYVGTGVMKMISDKPTSIGSYMFNIAMDEELTDDIYFDFKLRDY